LHAARKRPAKQQRKRNEKKTSNEHILPHWRQGAPLPLGKSVLGPAQLRAWDRGSFMDHE